MAKIKVNLHIDTKAAEARVADLAKSVLYSRRVIQATIESRSAAMMEFEERMRGMIELFRSETNEEIANAEALLKQIDATFEAWGN